MINILINVYKLAISKDNVISDKLETYNQVQLLCLNILSFSVIKILTILILFSLLLNIFMVLGCIVASISKTALIIYFFLALYMFKKITSYLKNSLIRVIDIYPLKICDEIEQVENMDID